MVLPCDDLYDIIPLDRAFVSRRLGIKEYEITKRLHKLKKLARLRGADRVTICLDDGEVYVSASEEHIGCLYDA